MSESQDTDPDSEDEPTPWELLRRCAQTIRRVRLHESTPDQFADGLYFIETNLTAYAYALESYHNGYRFNPRETEGPGDE